MKPAELNVYDKLPELAQTLSRLATMVCAMPLEDMERANNRVVLTGSYTREGTSTAIPPAEAGWTKTLINAAIGFRDAVAAPDPANPTQPAVKP